MHAIYEHWIDRNGMEYSRLVCHAHDAIATMARLEGHAVEYVDDGGYSVTCFGDKIEPRAPHLHAGSWLSLED